MNFIFLLIGLLLVIVLFQIFRSSEILGVATKKVSKSFEDSNNRYNAILGVIFLIGLIFSIFWYAIKEYKNYNLPIASEHAPGIELIFWVTMAITMSVFIVTQIVMFYFGYKYQYNEDRVAEYYPENNKLEIIWTIIPAIVMTVLIGWGLYKWNEVTGPAPADSEVIELVGYQFAWASRYPGDDNKLGSYNYKLTDVENIVGIDFSDSASLDDFMPREIHIPKGKPVLLKIRARDVIHSVYLPYFRAQMNAVPGMPTQLWFIPTKTTQEMREEMGNDNFNYEIICNKICGRAHFSMKQNLIVEEEWEYIKWKKSQDSWIKKNPDYFANFLKNNAKDLAVLNNDYESN